MSNRKYLLSVSYHTDDDTGMYYIGEIDYGISGELDEYLKLYGHKGKDDIIKALAHLTARVVNEFGHCLPKEKSEEKT